MAVKTIDFSSKHDCWIQNDDGTLSRMDEPYYRVKEVAPETWQIFSSGDFSYLVAGTEKAIAIDTGYGAGNIREYMQKLTDKPLEAVINTHDHFDHTANNGYFERAYMSKETIPLATVAFPSFYGIPFPTDYERIAVKEGDIFDLGERTLEVFQLADHAAGSIQLLDRKARILFSGDEINGPVKRLNKGVKSFFAGLEKLKAVRGAFDILCGGPLILDAALIDQFYDCARYILAGNEGVIPSKDMPPMTLPKSPDEEGRTVYHRQLPHPEDLHHDAEDGSAQYRRSVTYADVTIEYDLRLVND